jgi:hypothetical protein
MDGARINSGGEEPMAPIEVLFTWPIVLAHVWIHKIRRRCHQQPHRSGAPEGQGCRDHQEVIVLTCQV